MDIVGRARCYCQLLIIYESYAPDCYLWREFVVQTLKFCFPMWLLSSSHILINPISRIRRHSLLFIEHEKGWNNNFITYGQVLFSTCFSIIHGILFNSKYITRNFDMIIYHVPNIHRLRNLATFCIHILRSYQFDAKQDKCVNISTGSIINIDSIDIYSETNCI